MAFGYKSRYYEVNGVNVSLYRITPFCQNVSVNH